MDDRPRILRPARDPHQCGVVARHTDGGFGPYHRLDCPGRPQRGTPGVRSLIHGPWRYLAAHWQPGRCCQPPAPGRDGVERVAA